MLQQFIVLVLLIFFNHRDHCILIYKTDGVINMSICIITHNALIHPQYLIHAIVITEKLFNLSLVQMRIAVGIKQTGGGGHHRTFPVELH